MNTITTTLKNPDKRKWIENFARFGIYSKGVVYCLMGILTVLASLGIGGQKASKNEAFEVIYNQPFGKFLLVIIAIGLLGYVTWRFFQSVYDIDDKGTDAKAKFIRLGYAFSAVVYLSLAAYAIKLALSGAGSGNDNSQEFLINKILSYPAGAWAIGIAAFLFIGNGIRQIYKGISGKFMKGIQLVHAKYSDVFKKAGVAGYISRGIVLAIVGYFFLRASVHNNSKEVMGTKGAFDFLENNFGSLLMGLVAAGLIGYGIFMFVKARHQKIDLHF